MKIKSEERVMKKCSKCEVVKSLDEFHKNNRKKDGRDQRCKGCCKERKADWYLENKKKVLANSKKYYEENREKTLARQIAHNKGKKAEKKEYDKQYREDNKDKRNKWHRDKYQNDIEHRLHHLIKGGIQKALKRNDGSKQGEGTMRYLPYTTSQLKEHLENQFHPWMTWDNQGEWHIHHIIPQSKLRFDSVTHPNFQKCWALENLMPLEAKENMSLGNREKV